MSKSCRWFWLFLTPSPGKHCIYCTVVSWPHRKPQGLHSLWWVSVTVDRTWFPMLSAPNKRLLAACLISTPQPFLTCLPQIVDSDVKRMLFFFLTIPTCFSSRQSLRDQYLPVAFQPGPALRSNTDNFSQGLLDTLRKHSVILFCKQAFDGTQYGPGVLISVLFE